jgi:hypothetical protein
MCEEWWDERLLREQVEKLKRASDAPAPMPEPETADKPQPKPQRPAPAGLWIPAAPLRSRNCYEDALRFNPLYFPLLR